MTMCRATSLHQTRCIIHHANPKTPYRPSRRTTRRSSIRSGSQRHRGRITRIHQIACTRRWIRWRGHEYAWTPAASSLSLAFRYGPIGPKRASSQRGGRIRNRHSRLPGRIRGKAARNPASARGATRYRSHRSAVASIPSRERPRSASKNRRATASAGPGCDATPSPRPSGQATAMTTGPSCFCWADGRFAGSPAEGVPNVTTRARADSNEMRREERIAWNQYGTRISRGRARAPIR